MTMHSILVFRRKSRTAPVAFPFHSRLAEGALGCFHPHAFAMFFHIFLACGAQAWHLVKRWWLSCRLPFSHHQYLSLSIL